MGEVWQGRWGSKNNTGGIFKELEEMQGIFEFPEIPAAWLFSPTS
jgi:hypothetical protein